MARFDCSEFAVNPTWERFDACRFTPDAEAAEVADGSERRLRMYPGGALSPGLDPLLAVRLRELELEIKIEEREAKALHLKAVQVSAERDLELRRLSLAGDKPVPLPWSIASLSPRSPTTAGPQAAAAPPVPKPCSSARTTALKLAAVDGASPDNTAVWRLETVQDVYKNGGN
ncbi:hypothetical protein MHYP_G00031400 [Metynnis hypsauchen]